MKPVRTRALGLPATAAALLAAAAAWWLWPVPPIDAPYFHWTPGAEDRYELLVDHAAGNPDFRNGITTPRVPQSGTLRVRGDPGAAAPGAIVEVSNRRTGRASATTADAHGAFTLEIAARRGDELRVLSRSVTFRQPAAPRAQPVRVE